MSCANMCTVCLSVYTPKKAAGMNGNASCLFQGKIHAPNSGNISNGAQVLENILFTFISLRNYGIFFLVFLSASRNMARAVRRHFFKQYCNYQEQKASVLHQ